MSSPGPRRVRSRSGAEASKASVEPRHRRTILAASQRRRGHSSRSGPTLVGPGTRGARRRGDLGEARSRPPARPRSARSRRWTGAAPAACAPSARDRRGSCSTSGAARSRDRAGRGRAARRARGARAGAARSRAAPGRRHRAALPAPPPAFARAPRRARSCRADRPPGRASAASPPARRRHRRPPAARTRRSKVPIRPPTVVPTRSSSGSPTRTTWCLPLASSLASRCASWAAS